MKREHSAASLPSSSTKASSSERFCDYKKLNLLAFAGTLVYIGYILGCMENKDGDVPLRKYAGGGSLRATTSGDVWDNLDRSSAESGARRIHYEEGDFASSIDGMSRERGSVSYAKGPVINKHKGPATSINLIGERHSGTNWITDHLIDCFGDQISVDTNFTRFKHWFQLDDATIRNESAVVIAMFRDPYDWIEAMRERPHHAHEHIGMEWKDFVSKPWVGPRGPGDHAKMEKAKEEDFHIEQWGCLAGYHFDEVIPCSAEDSIKKDGYSNYMYELKHDQSHRAYGSVVELRTAKILNFMQIAKFHGVKAFFPQRYEALNLRGTADFLKQLEEVTGLRAKCEPFVGKGVVKHKNVDPEYTEWMNKYHDWDAEAMIGYVKRNPMPRKETQEMTLEQAELEAAIQSRQANAQIK